MRLSTRWNSFAKQVIDVTIHYRRAITEFNQFPEKRHESFEDMFSRPGSFRVFCWFESKGGLGGIDARIQIWIGIILIVHSFCQAEHRNAACNISVFVCCKGVSLNCFDTHSFKFCWFGSIKCWSNVMLTVWVWLFNWPFLFYSFKLTISSWFQPVAT